MKYIFLFTIFTPMLSFGQLSDSQKQVIDKYCTDMCECVSNVVNELNPKAVETISYLADNGADKMGEYVQKAMADLTEEEQQAYLASFEKMESPEFGVKLKNCEPYHSLGNDLKKQIDDPETNVYKYMMDKLESEDSCKILNLFYKLATSQGQD